MELDFPEIAEPEVASEVVATPTRQPAMSKEVALATIRTTALSELSAVARGIAELAKQHGATDYDITTTKGYKLATERRHAVRLVRYKVPHVVKARKAELKEISEAVESEGERIVKALRTIEDPHDALIEAEDTRKANEKAERERIEAERKAKHEAGIATIRGYVAQASGKTAVQIEAGRCRVLAIMIGDEWQEYREQAEAALRETLDTLQAMHDSAKAAEDAAAAAEAQRIEQARVAEEQRAEAKRLADAAAELAKKQREEDARIEAQRAELERQRAELEALRNPPPPEPELEPEPAAPSAEATPAAPASEARPIHPGVAETPVLAPRSFRREAMEQPPTRLAEATPAEVRNEWALFEHSLEHVLPVIEKHAAAIDGTRFLRSLERMRAVFA